VRTLICIASLALFAFGCESAPVQTATQPQPAARSIAQPLSQNPSACDAAGAVAESAADEVKLIARRVRIHCAQTPNANRCARWVDSAPAAEAALIAANAEMVRICSDADEIPGGSHCASVRTWSAAARAQENALLAALNAVRATATVCGSEVFPPAPALQMDAALRCTARLHSVDMAVRDFLDHTNPDGLDFADRIRATGYNFVTAGENLAAGQLTAQQALDGWLASPAHCANLVSPSFTELGVGFEQAERHWTVDLARPQNSPPPPPVDPCEVTADWDPAAAQLELAALQAINARRAAGAVCGGVSMPAVLPLASAPKLRCAARYHSQNMVAADFFDHTTPWGETYFDRLELVDYDYSSAGEAIGSGFTTAAAMVEGWMNSAGHCTLLMDPSYAELGVGYVADTHRWTAALGQPQ